MLPNKQVGGTCCHARGPVSLCSHLPSKHALDTARLLEGFHKVVNGWDVAPSTGGSRNGSSFLSFCSPTQGNSESQVKDPLGLLWPPDRKGRDSWDGEQERVVWCKAGQLLSPVGSSNLEVDSVSTAGGGPSQDNGRIQTCAHPLRHAGPCTEGLQPQYQVREPLVWPQGCGSPERPGQETGKEARGSLSTDV